MSLHDVVVLASLIQEEAGNEYSKQVSAVFHNRLSTGMTLGSNVAWDKEKADDNNYIYMDSKERIIKLHNKDTSYVDIDKKVITIHAIDKVHVKTKDFIVDASQKITMTTQAYTLKTSSYKVNANTYNTTVPVANFSANIKAGANVTAGATVKGAHISGGSYSGGHHS